jgi:hypothetical protein
VEAPADDVLHDEVEVVHVGAARTSLRLSRTAAGLPAHDASMAVSRSMQLQHRLAAGVEARLDGDGHGRSAMQLL